MRIVTRSDKQHNIILYEHPFQRRAHNPLLIGAEFDKTDVRVPWLGNKHLQFQFG
jgi:hypothetical protein